LTRLRDRRPAASVYTLHAPTLAVPRAAVPWNSGRRPRAGPPGFDERRRGHDDGAQQFGPAGPCRQLLAGLGLSVPAPHRPTGCVIAVSHPRRKAPKRLTLYTATTGHIRGHRTYIFKWGCLLLSFAERHACVLGGAVGGARRDQQSPPRYPRVAFAASAQKVAPVWAAVRRSEPGGASPAGPGKADPTAHVPGISAKVMERLGGGSRAEGTNYTRRCGPVPLHILGFPHGQGGVGHSVARHGRRARACLADRSGGG